MRIFNIDDLLVVDVLFDYGSVEVFGWGLCNSVGFVEDFFIGYIVSFFIYLDFWFNILYYFNDVEFWR